MNLPEDYVTEMKRLLKEDFPRYEESLTEPRFFGLRVNTLKITPEEFVKIAPFDLEPVPWIKNGFYYKESDRPSKHPYYYAGLFYIQEPSAMTPADILPVEPGDTVLDMCAAPGGKSTELGAKLKNRSLLVSNDISASRAKALLKNIEVFGISDACVISEDPHFIAQERDISFDKILIDAPCSGEGMFRKDNKLISAWAKNGPEYFSKIQRDIILLAADMLKPGGMMLYSTCTFNKMENEGSVIHLLSQRPDCHLVDIPKEHGFYPGYTDTEDEKKYKLDKCARLFPFALKGEGHFLALIQKDGERVETPGSFPFSRRKEKLSEETLEFLKHLKLPVDHDRIIRKDGKLYMNPTIEFMSMRSSGRNARFLRNGLYIGEEKKNRFEPSQALAMTMKSDEFDNVISLNADDIRVDKYLRGETISFSEGEINAENGNVLFCVDSYPLGWGKLNGMTMKNKYLPGWRKM